MQKLVTQASERLEGEWLLVGGAAAALWFSAARVTSDIDLLPLEGSASQRRALMELAVESGLPVEAVNSAADFFVRRIDGWRDELVVLAQGSLATIFRPTATLFVLLKIGRLSEIDLSDCVELLAHCRSSGETIDVAKVCHHLDQLAATDDEALRGRRNSLRLAIGTD